MSWRAFCKWAGYPYPEDVPICPGCGERVTNGEWPVYPWVCRKPVSAECWR